MFFKKRNKKEKEMTWMDVTLKQFNELQEIIKIEDETERLVAMMELFFGDKIEDLSIPEFMQKSKELDFLKTEMPHHNPPKKLEINGRKYKVTSLLGNISTVQYIDFMNHQKNNDLCKMVSVFVIPEGHKYNDGYDMEEVINDVYDFPAPIVSDLSAFFLQQLKLFIRIFRHYSIARIKKMKLTKERKKMLIKITEKTLELLPMG